MNNNLALLLYNKIISANFLWAETVCGMVKTQTEQMATDEDKASLNTERYPVATVTNVPNCESGKEFPCIPDGNKRSLIYFEDGGQTAISWLGRSGYQASLRLVCWFNRARIVEDGYSEQLIEQIRFDLIGLLAPRRHENPPGFLRLLGEVRSIPVADASIFSKYTYREVDKQYLRPPYDFFAIDFTFRYNPGPGCIEPLIYQSANCL